MVAQSPEPVTHDKNTRLFTVTLLLIIAIFAEDKFRIKMKNIPKSNRRRFTEQCRLVNQLLWSSRSRFYSKVVNENQSDQRKLFSTVDKLLHRTPDVIYPPHTNAEELARRFITFFANKISTIHQGLVQRCPNDAGYVDAPISSCTLTHFETVSVDDLLPLARRIYKGWFPYDRRRSQTIADDRRRSRIANRRFFPSNWPFCFCL